MGSIINNSCLTIQSLAATIAPLSQHGAVWFCRHELHKMPKARLICRLRYHMQKIIYGGRCLGRESVQGSCALSANPDNVHRPILCRISGVLNISQEVNTMSHPSPAQSSEQNQPKTINDLHQAFADLAFSYGMVTRDSEPSGASFVCFEIDCENLALIAQALRLQAKGGAL